MHWQAPDSSLQNLDYDQNMNKYKILSIQNDQQLKNQVGMIPAQTQLQTALSINLGSDGKAVSFSSSL